MGSDQAAARHSFAGGQPRSHAPANATAATTVTGAAMIRTAAMTAHLNTRQVARRAQSRTWKRR